MAVIKLEDIIEFTIGKNVTRMKKQGEDIYGSEDFESDLHSVNQVADANICVINMITTKAAPLSEKTKKKCITSNFISCCFDRRKLDPWYFCYQFNEGRGIEQQIAMYHQGTTVSVKKLTIKSIGDLQIQLPEIEKQKLIGSIYRQSIIQNDLLKKQAENIRKMTLATIQRIEGE